MEKLVPLCPTRWVERHDAVLVFIEFLPPIAVFLEDEMKLDANTGLLLAAIRDPRFLVGLVVVESVLAHTLEPSGTLQKKDGDMVSACVLIREIETIRQMQSGYREVLPCCFHKSQRSPG